MCGIVGIISKDGVTPRLVEGLRNLEYRGYDSAGIATLVNGNIERRRAEGKIANLVALLEADPLDGTTGIGHTRWATHGVANEVNAHPHATNRVALVHNGIIENFQELRDELEATGHVLESDTDTEVVVHLITRNLEDGLDPEAATIAALAKLKGAFALSILFAGEDDLMIAARRGSPLAIGYGEGEMFVGSDALALAPLTKTIAHLDDEDWVILSNNRAEIRDAAGRLVNRQVYETKSWYNVPGKDGHPHYMLKEIYEQPQVIGDTLHRDRKSTR
ncbi:MAG: glutamine--fructose-6-phosphate aminotransferase, partial [Rhodospirillales bacterium]